MSAGVEGRKDVNTESQGTKVVTTKAREQKVGWAGRRGWLHRAYPSHRFGVPALLFSLLTTDFVLLRCLVENTLLAAQG